MPGEDPKSEPGQSGDKRYSLWPERFLRAMAEKSWIYLLILWSLAFFGAVAGFCLQFESRVLTKDLSDYSVWGIIYYAAQSLLLNAPLDPKPSNAFLCFVAVLVPFLALTTAFAALSAIFKDKIQSFILHRYYTNHVVVCGLGRKGWLFVKDFRQQGERVVVIEKDGGNERLPECKALLVMVLIGNADDLGILEKAKVQTAKSLICVCGEDGTNAEIAVHARSMVSATRPSPLACLAHIFSPQLCNLLRSQIIDMAKEGAFRLEFFNIFQEGAWLLLDESDPFGDSCDPSVPNPHLLVIGLGWFGESLAVQAARNWQPRFAQTQERLTVSVLDRSATNKKKYLCARHPHVTTLCDVHALEWEIESENFQKAEFLDENGQITPVSSVYICLDNQSMALAAALTIYEKASHLKIPIVVRMDHDKGFGLMLSQSGDESSRGPRVKSFGLFDRTCSIEAVANTVTEKLARAIHEEYVADLARRGMTPKDKPLMKPWEQLTDEEKEGSRAQADHIGIKLREVGCASITRTDWDGNLFSFTDKEVERLARMEHERWCEYKRKKKGWHYSEVRNDHEKLHDCLVPWLILNPSDQETDKNTVRNLPSLLASVDLDIYRLK